MATGIDKGLLYKENEIKKVNRRQFLNKHMTLYLHPNPCSGEYETRFFPCAPTSNEL